jgi:hypothetical protein
MLAGRDLWPCFAAFDGGAVTDFLKYFQNKVKN